MNQPSLRVLVGTADPHLSRVVSATLMNEGHDVLHAPDARAAFHPFLTDPPDVVVLDVVVGDISGVEVARAVRRSPLADRVRILLLARDVVGTTHAVDGEGIHVLGKPLDVLALMDHLRDFARERAPAPTRAPAPSALPKIARRQIPRPSADKWALLGLPEGAVADEVARAADELIQSLSGKARLARSLGERTAASETAARVRAARTELLRHLSAGRGS